MTPSPLISVIIPTYNRSGILRLTLETVRRQTFKDFEVWIVGDGCSDDSEQAVASFGDDRFHWLNLPENSGTPGKPRNEGLKNANGQYIAYLGHDDLWFPWHLEGLLAQIRREEWDFVYSLGAAIGPEGVFSIFSLPENLKTQHMGISPSNWMHKRSLTEAIGPWSSKIKLGDDREFISRLRTHGAKMGCDRQLSVLKFPAGLWSMYSLSSNFPQEKYVKSMQDNAAALSQDVLLDFVSALSKDFGGIRGKKRLMEPLVRLIRPLFRLYGYDRWPLNRWINRRYRRRKGLPK